MQKRVIFALILFIAASIAAIPAATAGIKDSDTKSYASAGNSSETIRVFVKMKESQITKMKYGILAQKINAINSISEKIKVSGGNVTHTYKNLKVVAAEISREELEALKDDPNVEYVEEERVAHIFLQDSVPIINANDAWLENNAGVNITGALTSVCIIDTGVDTDHPDLADKIVGEHCFCYPDCCPNGSAEDVSAEDDHWHGTHVAGIVAASGGKNGVAIGANIVAVKTMDSSGAGYFSDILAGIEWCIDNADAYNISAISMSLGDSEYYNGTYCDTDDGAETTSNAVNLAVSRNISVVVATGNEDHTEGISFPACLFNTTKVGATDKSDNFASYSNRGGNFTDIVFAPGSSISSTYMGGGYASASGTSMATPHVSGTVALLSQAYKLKYGYFPAPSYLKQIFNDTGVWRYDPLSAKWYPRIDVFASLSVIGFEPRITSVFNNATGNGSATLSIIEMQSVRFEVNVTQDTSFMWLRNGSQASLARNLTWSTNYSDSGYWNITVVAYNANGSDSFEWIVTVIDNEVAVGLESPEDEIITRNRSVIFSYMPTGEDELIECALFTNESEWGADEWNSSIITRGISNNITHAFVSDGDYLWNVMCNDTYGQSAFASANRTVVVDATYPMIYIFELAGNYSQAPELNFSVTEIHIDSCQYFLNGGDNQTVSCAAVVGLTGVTEGTNNVTVCANDTAGNMNCTSAVFNYDTTGPAIGVLSPENLTYSSQAIFFNVSTDEDSDVCMIDVGSGNITMNGSSARNFNASITLAHGSYQLTVWCNDTLGNFGVNDSVRFFVDMIPPTIEIVSPVVGTDHVNWAWVNVSTDGAAGCLLSLNGGANASMANMSVIPSEEFRLNVSGLSEGWNNITAYCNDIAGNVNYTSAVFNYDTIGPVIRVLAPENLTYSSQAIFFNVSTDEDSDVCMIDVGSGNITMNGSSARNFNASIPLAHGSHQLTVWCNDTHGNFGVNDSVRFFVDLIGPSIEIVSPVAGTYNVNWAWANVSTEGAAACMLSLNSGGNTSMANMSVIPAEDFALNVSGLSEGWNNITAYCNDSSGNMNSTDFEFFVNTDYPALGLLYPADGVNFTSNEVTFNYTVSGLFVVECAIYGNFTGSWAKNETNSTVIVLGDNITAALNLSDGEYSWGAGCSDVGGKTYYSAANRSLVVDTVAPNISISYPLNGSTAEGMTNQITVNLTTDEYSYCRYNVSNNSFDFDIYGVHMNSTDGHNFWAEINASDGANYTIYYKCRDRYGNIGGASTMHFFRFELECTDNDGDGYGSGPGCLGTDCDDSNAGIYTGCTTNTEPTSSSSGGGGGAPSVTSFAISTVDEDAQNETDDDDAYENIILTSNESEDDEQDNADESIDGAILQNITRDIEDIEMAVERLLEKEAIDIETKEYYRAEVQDIVRLMEAGEYETAQARADELMSLIEARETAQYAILVTEDEENYGSMIIIAIGIISCIGAVAISGRYFKGMVHDKNQKMKEYIKMCMNNGHHEIDIKVRLTDNGWNIKDVDEAIAEVKKHENHKNE